MSDKGRNRARMALYAMAGFYLLYMAYSMFKNLSDSTGGEKVLVVLAMIFFVVVGGGLMIGGILKGYQMTKDSSKNQTPEDDSEKDETEDKME